MKKSLLVALMLLAGTLLAAAKKKVIRMATEATFPPYEYFQDGKIVGLDVEIVETICNGLGYQLQVMDMKFDSVILAVQRGKCEVGASGITVTEERKKQINFTLPYATAVQVIIVPKKDAKVGTVADMKQKGLRIGVQLGATGDMYVTKNIQEPLRFDNAGLAVAALAAGKLDVAVCDAEPARIHVGLHKNLKILPVPLAKEEYAFAISKNNPELLKKFNKQLKAMHKDGRLQKILDKYLKSANKKAGK